MSLLQLIPGALFAGDFQILRPLNEGGMGAVYVVLQLSTGKHRALKIMLPNLVADPSMRQRFEQEAHAGARIESEHVVEVVASGVDAATGTPWLAMELLSGEDLSSLVGRVGPLPLDDVRAIFRQLCHAMGAAHDAGIVHRDLKPENIFLARAKRAEVQFTVKVLDFGIAKLTADAKTQKTAAVGSPMWMAPEQTTRGGVIGPEADVWALGLIAFYLLTGRLFWLSSGDEGGTLATLIREMVLDPMPPASARAYELGARGLPPWFDVWFARTTRRETTGRFPNARDAFAAFEGMARGATPIPGATPPAFLPSGAATIAQPIAFSPGTAGTGGGGVATPGGSIDTPTKPPPKRAAWMAGIGILFVGALAAGWRAAQYETNTIHPLASATSATNATGAAGNVPPLAPLATSLASSVSAPTESPSGAVIPPLPEPSSAPETESPPAAPQPPSHQKTTATPSKVATIASAAPSAQPIFKHGDAGFHFTPGGDGVAATCTAPPGYSCSIVTGTKGAHNAADTGGGFADDLSERKDWKRRTGSLLFQALAIRKCPELLDKTEIVHAVVTFSPDGTVRTVSVDSPFKHPGREAAFACANALVREQRIPPFAAEWSDEQFKLSIILKGPQS